MVSNVQAHAHNNEVSWKFESFIAKKRKNILESIFYRSFFSACILVFLVLYFIWDHESVRKQN